MDYKAVLVACQQRYNTYKPSGITTTIWPNSDNFPTFGSSWAQFSLIFSTEIRQTLGPDYKNRLRGYINVNVFVPKGTGPGAAYGYADDIANIFRGKVFSGVHCEDASVKDIGLSEEWYQCNVSVRFYYDEIENIS